jgi:GNAT superfamily N-acetyltransferase
MIIFATYSLTKVLKKMFHVRPAVAGDGPAIIDFQLKMARETESTELDPEVLARGVTAVFNDAGKGTYYVGEAEGKVVSSMMITREWSDWRNQWVYWLQSVYVIPSFRKKGLFKMMYDHIRQQVMNDTGVSGIRLYVDASNTVALSVYAALGMDDEHYRLCEWMK